MHCEKITSGSILRFSLLALICSAILFDCDIENLSLPVERSEVIGTYVANYHAGLAESIELRQDSTYTYYYLATDSTEFDLEGRWRLDHVMEQPERPVIYLSDFMTPFAHEGGCYCPNCPPGSTVRDTIKGVYAITVYKTGRTPLTLDRCPVRKQYYVKVK